MLGVLGVLLGVESRGVGVGVVRGDVFHLRRHGFEGGVLVFAGAPVGHRLDVVTVTGLKGFPGDESPEPLDRFVVGGEHAGMGRGEQRGEHDDTYEGGRAFGHRRVGVGCARRGGKLVRNGL